ncbi:cellulase family glycosylhydrolase [Aquimarina sp. 2201CG5-10]|uniref:cellulase family glycosylhydrolase n=1 Tax=Aquimarina callyspongiae TaxID=3098150 RepID=UPI002AB51C78|nr:cellulase family glycosylhydrolase [Aquimarina sp. 2201CG5-10]MDY8137312.1 cellulase family glycosylhydrolase [Aquimarina sp. 2201CG5-10]
MSAITISGRVFMNGASRWSPKGLCYQPTNDVDPISDDNYATIDALLGKNGDWTKLGINAIRVYQVDPSSATSHDKVMSLLASKGIYVMIGCVNSQVALPRDGTYPCAVLDRVKSVVDKFQKYDNVLSFSVSNELLYATNQPNVAAAAKALVRDTKAYIVQKGYRSIPVGLVLRDDPSATGANTLAAAYFYACGSASDRVDYVAYNQYRWCDYTSTPPQGSINAWYELYQSFKDFPVPVYFGEYGCNSSSNRNWTQVPYLFGTTQLTPSGASAVSMSDVISGGFAFRYIQHTENLGLVSTSGTPILGNGFADLGTQYAAITSFAASSVAGTDPLPCSTGYNPTLPTACGGSSPSGSTITIKVTNEVLPATSISWSYSTDTNKNGATWIPIKTLTPGAPTTDIDVPTDAVWLSMAYKDVNSNQWYGGCMIAMSSVSAGDTVHGAWVANQGTCPLN